MRIVRRTLSSVSGGGVCNFDGRDRYRLGGRCLSAEEAEERVCYTWAAERFLCEGFWEHLPSSAAECKAMLAKLGVDTRDLDTLPDEPDAVRAFAKKALLAEGDNSGKPEAAAA